MQATVAEPLILSKKKIKSIVNDPVKSAKAASLIYVSDMEPGFRRVRHDDGFRYFEENVEITDEEVLRRIKRLVLPPAWENVWICKHENGHLQATGIDSKNRKQYKYHPLWNQVRNQTKFYHMIEFGKALPGIRLRLEKDLAKKGFPQERVLATIVSLMERSPIRVGNDSYEKLYGSFGLTTLKNKHVEINGSELHFKFKGKKGVVQDISVRSRRLSNLVRQCKEIPGKELFQYFDENGEKKSVDSGMVNNYIKEISNGDFTTKDYRTWAGTIHAFLAFKELGICETRSKTQKMIVSAMERVSKHLGNTRSVCKKYYVHPAIISMYESGTLSDYLGELDKIEVNDNKSDLTQVEKVVMKILSAAA
jgi:DNA topoisomerase I